MRRHFHIHIIKNKRVHHGVIKHICNGNKYVTMY